MFYRRIEDLLLKIPLLSLIPFHFIIVSSSCSKGFAVHCKPYRRSGTAIYAPIDTINNRSVYRNDNGAVITKRQVIILCPARGYTLSPLG